MQKDVFPCTDARRSNVNTRFPPSTLILAPLTCYRRTACNHIPPSVPRREDCLYMCHSSLMEIQYNHCSPQDIPIRCCRGGLQGQVLTVRNPKGYKKADTGLALFICIRFQKQRRTGKHQATAVQHEAEESFTFTT